VQLVSFIARAADMIAEHGTHCGLEHWGIFIVEPAMQDEECLPPSPGLALFCGIPLAHEQGAEGVCTAIGDLVQRKIFPALKEVSKVFHSTRCCCCSMETLLMSRGLKGVNWEMHARFICLQPGAFGCYVSMLKALSAADMYAGCDMPCAP